MAFHTQVGDWDVFMAVIDPSPEVPPLDRGQDNDLQGLTRTYLRLGKQKVIEAHPWGCVDNSDTITNLETRLAWIDLIWMTMAKMLLQHIKLQYFAACYSCYIVSYVSKIWQVTQQQCCWVTCQILETFHDQFVLSRSKTGHGILRFDICII